MQVNYQELMVEKDAYIVVGLDGALVSAFFKKGQFLNIEYVEGVLKAEFLNIKEFVVRPRWADIVLENTDDIIRISRDDLEVIQRILPHCSICGKIGTYDDPLVKKQHPLFGTSYEHRMECDWEEEDDQTD